MCRRDCIYVRTRGHVRVYAHTHVCMDVLGVRACSHANVRVCVCTHIITPELMYTRAHACAWLYTRTCVRDVMVQMLGA